MDINLTPSHPARVYKLRARQVWACLAGIVDREIEWRAQDRRSTAAGDAQLPASGAPSASGAGLGMSQGISAFLRRYRPRVPAASSFRVDTTSLGYKSPSQDTDRRPSTTTTTNSASAAASHQHRRQPSTTCRRSPAKPPWSRRWPADAVPPAGSQPLRPARCSHWRRHPCCCSCCWACQ